MRRSLPLLALSLVALPLAAQTKDPGVAATHAVWKSFADYVVAAAEEMPEAKYGYRPVASVRTFGELVGHVAGAQHLICAAALGEPQPAEDAVEKSATTKAALIAALKASNTHCEHAYAQRDAALAGGTTLFGQKQTKMWALALNAAHTGEHYGNIVTYLRMNGMVPPSSR